MLIELLIRQAKEYEKKDEEKIAKKSFGSFFSIVVYPIIAGISGIIVKNISDEQIVTLGITVMFLLIFAFALYSIIYPEIKKNENKFLQVASIMPFPVCAKEPVRYQIRLAKPALLILHPTNRMSFRLL